MLIPNRIKYLHQSGDLSLVKQLLEKTKIPYTAESSSEQDSLWFYYDNIGKSAFYGEKLIARSLEFLLENIHSPKSPS